MRGLWVSTREANERALTFGYAVLITEDSMIHVVDATVARSAASGWSWATSMTIRCSRVSGGEPRTGQTYILRMVNGPHPKAFVVADVSHGRNGIEIIAWLVSRDMAEKIRKWYTMEHATLAEPVEEPSK